MTWVVVAFVVAAAIIIARIFFKIKNIRGAQQESWDAKIIDQLIHSQGLPKAALRVASAHQDKMVPAFLAEIDSYLALSPADRAKPTPLFFIFHLLGE